MHSVRPLVSLSLIPVAMLLACSTVTVSAGTGGHGSTPATRHEAASHRHGRRDAAPSLHDERRDGRHEAGGDGDGSRSRHAHGRAPNSRAGCGSATSHHARTAAADKGDHGSRSLRPGSRERAGAGPAAGAPLGPGTLDRNETTASTQRAGGLVTGPPPPATATVVRTRLRPTSGRGGAARGEATPAPLVAVPYLPLAPALLPGVGAVGAPALSLTLATTVMLSIAGVAAAVALVVARRAP